jgi:hypothetical protein
VLPLPPRTRPGSDRLRVTGRGLTRVVPVTLRARSVR